MVGRWIFSLLVSLNATYTFSIGFFIEKLKPGYCLVSMRDSFWVRNPFKSIHAVALANLGELASGLAVLSLLEQNPKQKGIVTLISAKYLKKVVDLDGYE